MKKASPPFARIPNLGSTRRSGAAFSPTQTTESVTIRSIAPADRAQPPDVRTTASWRPVALPLDGGQRANEVIVVPPDPATPQPLLDGSGKIPSAFRVGQYEVAARIARGAMGSVYVCRKLGDQSSSRLLTMKVVRQHTVKPELAAASFRHEAQVGLCFRHVNAQTVIDTGFSDGQPFLILDYVDGLCLADVLTTDSRPPPAVAVAIILDVLAALHALHQAKDGTGKWLGLVHCDVSPENVLVGLDGAARLSDFGSARFTATTDQAQAFALSKPSYMPPEQFRGEKLDARSDLYSTGVLLWTALTGHQPFVADGYEETVINVMRKKLKPPSASGAPACFDEICAQAMSRSPEDRFMVANAMAAALRTAAVGQGLVASRAQVGQWVSRAMGDEIARRRRRIEAAFAGGSEERPIEPEQRDARPEPAAQESTDGFDLTDKRFPTALSRRDRVIITAATLLTFAATVAIGVAVTGK